MKQHKWHKEIKAWADGVEIESIYLTNKYDQWHVDDDPCWNNDEYEFRIKPQPKEPKYLYVYLDDNYELSPIPIDNDDWKYIGKIKLEDNDG
jgi:hypothetical protein